MVQASSLPSRPFVNGYYELDIGIGYEPPQGVAVLQGCKTADHADARRSGVGIYLRQSALSAVKGWDLTVVLIFHLICPERLYPKETVWRRDVAIY